MLSLFRAENVCNCVCFLIFFKCVCFWFLNIYCTWNNTRVKAKCYIYEYMYPPTQYVRIWGARSREPPYSMNADFHPNLNRKNVSRCWYWFAVAFRSVGGCEVPNLFSTTSTNPKTSRAVNEIPRAPSMKYQFVAISPFENKCTKILDIWLIMTHTNFSIQICMHDSFFTMTVFWQFYSFPSHTLLLCSFQF